MFYLKFITPKSCLVHCNLSGQVLNFMRMVVNLLLCEFEGWPLISHCGLTLTRRGCFMHLITLKTFFFYQKDFNKHYHRQGLEHIA